MKLKALMPVLSMAACSAFAQSSGLDKANMDLSKKPGTDFYEYSCGTWMKNHPLTPEYARYGQFNYLSDVNEKQIHELIEGLASHPQQQGSLAQKIGSLYKLAMDSVRRNKEGYESIKPVLAKVAAPTNKTELLLMFGQLGHRGIDVLPFSIYADADLRNAKMNLVGINQGGLSLGDRDYYLNDDEATLKIRNAYKDYVKKILEMAGNDAATAERKMKAVLDIETAIAKESYSATKQRDVEGNYHKMTYAQLLSDYPGIDWGSLFLQLGFPAFAEVTVNQPEPIHAVEKLLAEKSLDDWKAYAEFKVVNDAANALDDSFRAAFFDFYSHTMSGVMQDRARWKRAVDAVNGVLGMAVGKLYVEKYFPESSKQRMLELVNNLKVALGQRIDQQNWMSPATKAQAHDKLNHFYVKIGYPDKWRDYSNLQIDENLSYYENLLRAGEFMMADMIQRKVNKPTDKTEWLMTPQTINAYYNPTTNEICFPAGILQPPFFNPEADDAVNYGAIGVVIGHEMTHGFDDQGSQFDKDGNLRNWWTEADKKNFEARTKVMADFFDKIEVLPGLKANGKLTLGENIADHGGLNISYQALQNAMKKNPLKTVDGFTPEQRFFLSFAFIWASNIRDEQLRVLNKVDPHSPARWRVNGALPHIDSWYKAFNITSKDPLFVPKKNRVDIW